MSRVFSFTSKKRLQTCVAAEEKKKQFCLTLSQTTNFRPFQAERACRRQFEIQLKWKKVIHTGRKHCGKRKIAHYEQFLLFPQCFQKNCTADT